MKKLTIKEFAAVMQVSTDTVRRWIRENKVHAEKLPKKGFILQWFINEDEVKKFTK